MHVIYVTPAKSSLKYDLPRVCCGSFKETLKSEVFDLRAPVFRLCLEHEIEANR